MATTHLTEQQIVARLRAGGSVFAEDEARLLLAERRSPTALESGVARRERGIPLEHVLGWAAFDGHRVLVDERVFVPRRRTELLAREAAAIAHAGDTVIDLCCGCGAVGLAIARRVPGIALFATDIDPIAVANARRNLEPLEATVVEGDLFDALPTSLRGTVAVIAVNAPYVPVDAIALLPPEAREFESRVALDGGADGLDLHRRIAAAVGDWLAPSGHLLIESSAAQAPLTAAMLRACGLASRIVRDDDIDATIVIGSSAAAGTRA